MGFLWGLGRGPVVSEIGEFETSFAGSFLEVGHRLSRRITVQTKHDKLNRRSAFPFNPPKPPPFRDSNGHSHAQINPTRSQKISQSGSRFQRSEKKPVRPTRMGTAHR